MSEKPIIDIHNVSKTYNYMKIRRKEQGPGLWFANIARLKRSKEREVRALNNISFSVEKGEVFAVVGPNGAGKTTLMKILSGIIYPTTGKGKIAHFDIIKDHKKLKEMIAFVSASFWMGLEWQLTAMENILQYATLMGVNNAREKADELIHFFGMESFKNKRVPELSAGMRQLVSIARGFIVERPIIYLDEPFVSIDVEKRKLLSQLIEEKQSEGKTILISSQVFTDLDVFHPRALFLNKGEVVGIGRANELMKENNLIPYEVSIDAFDKETEKVLLNKGIIATPVPDELIQLNNVFTVRLLVRDGMANNLIKELIKRKIHIFELSKKDLSLKDAYLYRVKNETYH